MLLKTGHLEKVKQVDGDCFLSPVVITVKNDKPIEIALDSRKLNNSCIKIRPHMPNMEEQLNEISVEITRDRTKKSIISKIRSRLRMWSDEVVERNKPTMRIRNNWGKIQRIPQIQKRFLRIRRNPDHLPRKMTEHKNSQHRPG